MMYFCAALSRLVHGRSAQDGSWAFSRTQSRQPGGSQTLGAGLAKEVAPVPLKAMGRSLTALLSQLTNRIRLTPTLRTEAQACAFPSSRRISIPA